jgi:hypothetical protein
MKDNRTTQITITEKQLTTIIGLITTVDGIIDSFGIPNQESVNEYREDTNDLLYNIYSSIPADWFKDGEEGRKLALEDIKADR